MQRVITVIVLILSLTLVVVLFTREGQPETVLQIQKQEGAPVKFSSYKFEEAPEDTTPVDPKILSYVQEIIAMNKDEKLVFQSDFRSGHVTPKVIDNYLERSGNGFTLRVSGNTQVITPAVYEDKLYVSGGFGSKSYYCFDAASGNLVWAVDLDDDGPSAAAFADSTIVFNTESCTIFALNSRTGKMLWSYWLGDPLMTTPMIANGKVFTSYPSMSLTPEMKSKYKQAQPSHAFACFDLHTGKILWQKWLDADVLTSPVAYGGSVYLTTFAGTVYKMSQKDGEIESATHLRATSIPSIDKGRIYITKRADKDGKVCESIAVLDAANLKKLSEFNTVEAPYLDEKVQDRSVLKQKSVNMDAVNGFVGGAPEISGYKLARGNIGVSNVSSLQSFQGSSVFTRNGRVYNCMGNRIYCIDPKTKNRDWEHSIDGKMEQEGGYMSTAPIAAGDYLVTVTLNGTIKVMDMKSGDLVKEIATSHEVRTQPIVHKGRIYMCTTAGTLVCIDTGDEKIDGWPMMMMNSEHRVN